MASKPDNYNAGDAPDITEARDRLHDAIDSAFSQSTPTLIDALPSIGKSRGVVEWVHKTGHPVTVFTVRKELYQQYAEWARERDLRFKRLPSFQEDCETANGTYDGRNSWSSRVREAYRNGLRPSEIHSRAKALFGESLPCEPNCTYRSKREFEPEDYDIILGNFRYSYTPGVVEGRYIVFDEFPNEEFLEEYSPELVASTTAAFCRSHEDFPVSFKKEIDTARQDPAQRDQLLSWFRDNGSKPLYRNAQISVDSGTSNAHPNAGAIVYSLVSMSFLDNGWGITELPDKRVTVLDPKSEKLIILNRPSLADSKGVLALDGTPSVLKWELVLGDDLVHDPILTDSEKSNFLLDQLNIEVIQTTHRVKTYSSGTYVTPRADLALIEAIAEREHSDVYLITTKKALSRYESNGLPDVVQGCMYYGNLKGSNQFKQARVGVVIGSPHHGDDYVLKYAALRGISAERKGAGPDLSYGTASDEILRSMRENEVLQAVLRFGRDSKGATVYVHTAALPAWVNPVHLIADIYAWENRGSSILEILETITESDTREWRTSDISESVGVSANTTRKHLKRLASYGFVSNRREGQGFVWRVEDVDSIPQFGVVKWRSSEA